MTLSIAKWKLDDYHRIVEMGLLDDRPVELLYGEIVQMSPEGEPHAYFSSEAGDYLSRLLGNRALVRQAKPITLPNDSEPEADIVIVQRLGREYLSHHPYPENIFWVIEYSQSSLEKDSTVKYRLYAEAGIAEYWLVNLGRRELIIYRDPRDGEYGSKITLTEGEVTPLAFAEIQIPVEALISAD
ncbi:Uma2 family endonuclease [Planktothrix mougeotii]|uniref:Uma2 family endonuclease n=1 Tax=Planktothrix mougeotii LEGE 06226 TaxID=1828728 RepID=A0ABR9U9Q3_9CYAN|nr:Uma2 family endonuclease [Planktothrix mougeotii]MBE9143167.1 Uma2 family endonuclease [Planktothrix mougeotii LEGE 06226]